jgi:chromosome segregation ATPase
MMDKQQLEHTIKRLIDRRNELSNGGAECEAIEHQLHEMIERYEDAGLIVKEYQSLLETLPNYVQELEDTIRRLIERKDAAVEGSAEYRMVIRQLKGLRNSQLAAEIWKNTTIGVATSVSLNDRSRNDRPIGTIPNIVCSACTAWKFRCSLGPP